MTPMRARPRPPVPRGFAATSSLASSGFLWAGAVFGAIVMVVLAFYVFGEPTTLRLAVGPPGSDEAKLAAVLQERMSRPRRSLGSFRLEIVPTASPLESAAALDARRADLAFVRGDAGYPRRGTTVLVAHKDAALILTPAKGKIDSVAKLGGKRIGVYPPDDANLAFLGKILAHSGVPGDAYEAVGLSEQDLAAAIAQKKIAAAMIVEPLTSPAMKNTVALVGAAARDKLVALKVEGAEALSEREPGWASVEVGAGAFDGSPPWPADEIKTSGVLWTLEADHDLGERLIGNLAEALYSRREDIAVDAPIFAFMEKPEAERTSRHPVHPGAWAYYSDSTKSWSDQYGDLVYMGAMALSAFGSGIAALFGVTGMRSRRRALTLIDEVIDAKHRAHVAEDLDTLSKIHFSIEELSTTGLRYARDGVFDDANISALKLAMSEARRALIDRREELLSREQRPTLSIVGKPNAAGV